LPDITLTHNADPGGKAVEREKIMQPLKFNGIGPELVIYVNESTGEAWTYPVGGNYNRIYENSDITFFRTGIQFTDENGKVLDEILRAGIEGDTIEQILTLLDCEFSPLDDEEGDECEENEFCRTEFEAHLSQLGEMWSFEEKARA
jgi:hypothetical protein